jgi:two-component system, LuxR family, response regulator FixJ
MPAAGLIDRRAYVIDDEPGLRSLVRRILTPAGILTEEFESGEAFLPGLHDRPLGCILLDVNLPGLSGLELLDRLRAEGIRDPVIMVSGHGDIPLALGAVKAGAMDFIEKPFRKEQLLKVVGEAFEAVAALQNSGEGKIGSLTAREREVLDAFRDGTSNKVVARELHLSVRTVETHRANILKKLEVENLTQALFLAKDSGLLRE